MEHINDDLAMLVAQEYDTLPEIRRLDEYIHFEEQLGQMRARSATRKHHHTNFAMELAVYLRLIDYSDVLGLPVPQMPHGDGQGGLIETTAVPQEWLGDKARQERACA